MESNFLAGQASIWIQPNGPNTKPEYLGCHAAGDVEEPQGDVTLLYCPDPANAGKYKVKNSYQSAPDPVSFTLDTDLRKTADYLERIKFSVPVFIHKTLAGRRDDFSNFERSFILRQARITNRTLSNLASRNPDDEDESGQSFEMAALELLRVFNLTETRITITETQGLNSIAVGGEDRPEGAGLAAQNYGDVIITGGAAGSGVTPNLLITTNGGVPAAVASDPLIADQAIQGIVTFKMGKNTTRILAGQGTTAAAAALRVYRSDDFGATSWSYATLGATNGEFVSNGHAMFALDARNIWVGTNLGNVYFSSDGGVTWIRQTATPLGSAVIGISFYDSMYGFLVLTGGAAYKTIDGGLTWSAAGTTGTSAARDIHMITRYIVFVCGTDGLFYTNDGGANWATRMTGNFAALDFRNEQEGLLAGGANGGLVYQTIDGGFTWSAMALVTNAGYTDIKWVDSRKAYVVGAASGGTGFYGMLTPAP